MQFSPSYRWAGILGLVTALSLTLQPSQVNSVTTQKTSENTEFSGRSTSLQDSVVMDYFMEIALGSEWGAGEAQLHRWQRSQLNIAVLGAPTAADWQGLRQVAEELSRLTGMVLQLHRLDEGLVSSGMSALSSGEGKGGVWGTTYEIEIHFRPESQFLDVLPTYQSGNKGFVWTWWSATELEKAVILIASEGLSAMERTHLIREELTQSLGLMQDSWKWEDSIFYQGWTTTQTFSPLDRELVRMLYRPELRHGMNRQQIEALGLGLGQ